MIMKFEVPGEPCGKGRPRFNRKTGMAYTPEKTASYENLVKLQYMAAANGFRFSDNAALAIRLMIYYSIPKSASKRRQKDMLLGIEKPTKKPDCDNVIKSIADALCHVAYRDDAQIVYIEAVKKYAEVPRVEVVLCDYGSLFLIRHAEFRDTEGENSPK